MSRYLFVVPPLVGHINPTVAVGGELAARGHEVAWVGHPATLRTLLPEGALILPALDDELERRIQDAHQHWLRLRGMAVVKFFWEDFMIPLARAMVPGVEAAVREFAPDVVVADQQALAGPLVAHRTGTPWVTSASTPAELFRPLKGMPKVEAWVSAQLDDLVRDCLRIGVARVVGEARELARKVEAAEAQRSDAAPADRDPAHLFALPLQLPADRERAAQDLGVERPRQASVAHDRDECDGAHLVTLL
jgi:hypothetical protein